MIMLGLIELASLMPLRGPTASKLDAAVQKKRYKTRDFRCPEEHSEEHSEEERTQTQDKSAGWDKILLLRIFI
jgi:hypothetical protein